MLKGIEGISTYATDVDNAFIIVTVITLFLFVITIGSMLYFVYRYRASKNAPHETKNIKHYTPIEIAWTVIPTILMMIVFYFGLESLRVQRTMPSDDEAIKVKVLAQRWSWQFEYENGLKSRELTVPVNQNIKLVMRAPVNDVIHSFYVPAFRAKEDILPGETTYLWFNATKTGTFDIQCAEYCGTRHSYMRSYVHVVDDESFKTFITPQDKPAQKSAVDILNDYGCTACHSLDGSPLVGPSFQQEFRKEITVITNGVKRTIKRDVNYLKNSILNPNKDIVENFAANMMPSFKGQISDKELNIVLDFLKSDDSSSTKEQKTAAPTQRIKKPLNGLELIQNNGCIGCHSLDGSKIVGPTFKDIYNRDTTLLKDGKTVQIKADESYLKNAILNPKSEVVEGYPNLMPSFKGILNEDELKAIIEYLKEPKE